MITAKDVIRAIELHYEGGVLQYDGGWTEAEKVLKNRGQSADKTIVDVQTA